MTKSYSGAPKLRQFSFGKKTYKAKNENDGIKCKFSQSKEYRARAKVEGRVSPDYKSSRRVLLPSGIISVATPWYGWEE